LANLLIEKERLSEAQPFLEDALKVEPDNFMVYLSLGHVFYGQRDFDKAIAYYAVASELNPEYADTYYYLSLTLGKMNRHDEALEQGVHYISLSPQGDYANAVQDLILNLKKQSQIQP
jgi:tetratricopeptide (TPR) repeat protein